MRAPTPKQLKGLAAAATSVLASLLLVGAPSAHDGALGRPSGIVPPHHPGVTSAAATGPTSADNLTYGAAAQQPVGDVMHSAENFALYWIPSGYSVAANYRSVIDGFFANLAADSGASTNVFATTTQYADQTGSPFSGTLTFGGGAVDSASYPASGCHEPSEVQELHVCVTDAQIAAEVARFAAVQGWPDGQASEIFVYTPPGVGSCLDAAGNGCAYTDYCAYHNELVTTGGRTFVYANIPWPNQPVKDGTIPLPSVCDNDEHPNGSGSTGGATALDAADEAINVTSHEASESITDPDGAEWWDDTPGSSYRGYENGDLCAWYFPSAAVLGHTATGKYNQRIGSGQYFIQGEWSNAEATGVARSGCAWSYVPSAPVNVLLPAISGKPRAGSTLTADDGSWSGVPSSYSLEWERCDAAGSDCTPIDDEAGSSYLVSNADAGRKLRVAVTATNAFGTTPVVSQTVGPVTTPAPVSTAPPAITGPTRVNATLRASAGGWAVAPSHLTYRWLRCDSSGTTCTVIARATGTSYSPVRADAGRYLAVAVTAVSGRGSTTVQSTPVGPVRVLGPPIPGRS